MTVVVGYIDRPDGHAALRQGALEAQLRSLPLKIVRALPAPVSHSSSRMRAWQGEFEAARADRVGIVERVGDRQLETTFEVVARDPVTALLDASRSADLLVIGLRQRTAVGKLLLGSVAQDVLLGASCDVLALPVPQLD